MPKKVKTRKQKKSNTTAAFQFLKKNSYYILLLLILLFSFSLSVSFFYGPSWINGSDNYVYTQDALMVAQGHVAQVGSSSVKFLVLTGIAFFYLVLGYNMFSAALFGITCILLTMAVLYFIGKELHSREAGLFAALLYAIVPMVQVEGSAVGDDVTMVFFLSLSVLLVIMALKTPNGRRRNTYFLLAGFVSVINYLSVGEALVGTLFILVLLLVNFTLQHRQSIKGIVFFLGGAMIAGAVITLIGFGIFGNPFYVEHSYQSTWSSYNNPSPFLDFAGDIFSNSLLAVPSGNLFSSSSSASYNTLAFGYLGVALVVSLFYLLLKRDKRALMPALWFAVGFLYISFGSQSMFSYVPLSDNVRYAMMVAPAMVLLIAMFLADLIKSVAHLRITYRLAAYIFTVIFIGILIASSIVAIRAADYSEAYGVLPVREIDSFVSHLPTNTSVAFPYGTQLLVYLNQSTVSRMGSYPYADKTCNTIIPAVNPTPGTYIVGNVTNSTSCNLAIVFTPFQEGGLENYTVFGWWSSNFFWTNNVYIYFPPANSTTGNHTS